VQDLFGAEPETPREADAAAPLASRMRPSTLEELVGQEHILAPDPFDDLIPRYQFSPSFHQQKQQFHGDAGQPQSFARAAQLVGATVQFEIVRQSQNVRSHIGDDQGKLRALYLRSLSSNRLLLRANGFHGDLSHFSAAHYC